jgi:hypothetical protein
MRTLIALIASITLTNPSVLNVNGSPVETNATSALTELVVNYGGTTNTGSTRLRFCYGNGGNTFTAGSQIPCVVMQIDLATGAWTASTGQSGTLPATPLSNFQTAMRNIRNNLEVSAINTGVLPGTQVPW